MYLGRRENVSMPNALQGSWVNMLGVLLVRLHKDFVSLISSLTVLWMSGIEKGVA